MLITRHAKQIYKYIEVVNIRIIQLHTLIFRELVFVRWRSAFNMSDGEAHTCTTRGGGEFSLGD